MLFVILEFLYVAMFYVFGECDDKFFSKKIIRYSFSNEKVILVLYLVLKF